MVDGHLGQVGIAKNRIELTPENTPQIHSAPYLAGLKARKFKETEINKKLLQKVLEPAQSE